ncbi:hypothetical protein C0993_003869, partial [Termitomyces sp. T159_Od127]
TQQAQATATAQATPATPAVQCSVAPTAPAASSSIDTREISELHNALGSVGVDFWAKEETLQRTHEQQPSYRYFKDCLCKQPPAPAFDTRILGVTMRTISTKCKIAKIPNNATNYLTLALCMHLQDLVATMITASCYHTDIQFDCPATLYLNASLMWSIIICSNVAKQLAALKKVECEEETKIHHERKKRQDMATAHAAVLAAQANSGTALSMDGYNDLEGSLKKKRKKEGSGVMARNMLEEIRKKISNAVAMQAAGLGRRCKQTPMHPTSLKTQDVNGTKYDSKIH